jgi:DNA repair photolyase
MSRVEAIYTPKGKAREYSPLALNLYTGCDHGCVYCYAPDVARQERDKYTKIKPKKDILNVLEKQLETITFKDQVLMSFMSDPYNSLNDDLNLTAKALRLLRSHEVPVAILSKAGFKMIRDQEVILSFGSNIKVGATLTFDNTIDSKNYEPYAANWNERLATLKAFKNMGIKTFASFEPVFFPEQALHLMEVALEHNAIDLYKVGKLNHLPNIEATINWTEFLEGVIERLRGRASFYIKNSLREAAPSVKLYPEEINSDIFALKGWH